MPLSPGRPNPYQSSAPVPELRTAQVATQTPLTRTTPATMHMTPMARMRNSVSVFGLPYSRNPSSIPKPGFMFHFLLFLKNILGQWSPMVRLLKLSLKFFCKNPKLFTIWIYFPIKREDHFDFSNMPFSHGKIGYFSLFFPICKSDTLFCTFIYNTIFYQ